MRGYHKDSFQRPLPDNHDASSRAAALMYTREAEFVTTGVLYEVSEPTLLDRLGTVKVNALAGNPQSTVQDIIKSFQPSF